VSRSTGQAVAIGLLAGFVSGLFGVGGGVIVVPGLVLWLGMDQRRAAGTSMATIVAASVAAVILFGRDRAVDWPAAAWLFAGAGVGAIVGARMLGRIPELWLTRAFTLVLLAATVRLAIG
jgi:uncharacterized membrane protein YfcA